MKPIREIIQDLTNLADQKGVSFDKNYLCGVNEPSKPDAIDARFKNNNNEISLIIRICAGLGCYCIVFSERTEPNHYHKTEYDKMLKDIENWLQNKLN